MMSHLRSLLDDGSLVDQQFSAADGQTYIVKSADDFEYVDPIDKSLTAKQVRFHVKNRIL